MLHLFLMGIARRGDICMSQTTFSSVLSLTGSLYIFSQDQIHTMWILVLHFFSWKLTGFLGSVCYY